MAEIIKFQNELMKQRENLISELLRDVLNYLERMDGYGASIRECIDGIHRAMQGSKQGDKYEINPK